MWPSFSLSLFTHRLIDGRVPELADFGGDEEEAQEGGGERDWRREWMEMMRLGVHARVRVRSSNWVTRGR